MENDPKDFTPKAPGRVFFAGWIFAVMVLLLLTVGLVLARNVRLNRQGIELDQQMAAGRARAGRARRTRSRLPHRADSGDPARLRRDTGVREDCRLPQDDLGGQGRSRAQWAGDRDARVARTRRSSEATPARPTIFNASPISRNQTLRREGVIAAQTADEARAAMVEAKATLEPIDLDATVQGNPRALRWHRYGALCRSRASDSATDRTVEFEYSGRLRSRRSRRYGSTPRFRRVSRRSFTTAIPRRLP